MKKYTNKILIISGLVILVVNILLITIGYNKILKNNDSDILYQYSDDLDTTTFIINEEDVNITDTAVSITF